MVLIDINEQLNINYRECQQYETFFSLTLLTKLIYSDVCKSYDFETVILFLISHLSSKMTHLDAEFQFLF